MPKCSYRENNILEILYQLPIHAFLSSVIISLPLKLDHEDYGPREINKYFLKGYY